MTSREPSPLEEGDFRAELERILRPVLTRVRLRHLMAWFWPALLSALAVSGLILGLSHAFLWYGAGLAALCTGSVVLAGALVAAWMTRPGLADAARTADGLGLAERTVTALELAGQSGELVRLQRQDALQRLQDLDSTRVSLRWSAVAGFPRSW